MDVEVTKKEVEDLLKYEISDILLEEALEYAKRKQKYIFSRDPRPVVMQHWYLVALAKEYAISLAFSYFTMDLCKSFNNMEKEHSVIDQSTPLSNHIVTY